MKGFTGVGAAFLKDVMVAANALYDANNILNGMWANINKLTWDQWALMHKLQALKLL